MKEISTSACRNYFEYLHNFFYKNIYGNSLCKETLLWLIKQNLTSKLNSGNKENQTLGKPKNFSFWAFWSFSISHNLLNLFCNFIFNFEAAFCGKKGLLATQICHHRNHCLKLFRVVHKLRHRQVAGSVDSFHVVSNWKQISDNEVRCLHLPNHFNLNKILLEFHQIQRTSFVWNEWLGNETSKWTLPKTRLLRKKFSFQGIQFKQQKICLNHGCGTILIIQIEPETNQNKKNQMSSKFHV